MVASSRCRAPRRRRRSRKTSSSLSCDLPRRASGNWSSCRRSRWPDLRMHRRISGKLVIATHNPGKLAEMRELLAPFGVAAVSARELGLPEPEEPGTTFQANARIKAEAAAKATNMPAFSDDSGLAVDALDGQPGIHSARWGGPRKDFRGARD